LLLLRRFGPECLTERELNAALTACVEEYYGFLARSVVPFREPEFWRFHKEKLASLGYPFRASKLAGAIFARFARLALHPRKAISALSRLVRARNGAGRAVTKAPSISGGY
jgi:hypothetical protein